MCVCKLLLSVVKESSNCVACGAVNGEKQLCLCQAHDVFFLLFIL